MRAPTNPVSINHVGTGVLDRPLIQRNLRTVREAGPYEHRVRLCEIKELYKPQFVGFVEGGAEGCFANFHKNKYEMWR